MTYNDGTQENRIEGIKKGGNPVAREGAVFHLISVRSEVKRDYRRRGLPSRAHCAPFEKPDGSSGESDLSILYTACVNPPQGRKKAHGGERRRPKKKTPPSSDSLTSVF